MQSNMETQSSHSTTSTSSRVVNANHQCNQCYKQFNSKILFLFHLEHHLLNKRKDLHNDEKFIENLRAEIIEEEDLA